MRFPHCCLNIIECLLPLFDIVPMNFRITCLSGLLILFVSFPLLAQKPGSYTAIEFDGANDYISIADNSALNPTSAITVEAWIKADAYGANSWSNSIFCKHGWSSGNQGYVLRCGDDGKASFNIASSSGTWYEAITGNVMKTGKWYHVAGTFNGDSICVYINGNLEAVYTYSGTMRASSGLNPRIGDLAYNGGRLFDGQIDEVRVWGTALSKATIRNWMCRRVSSTHPGYGNLAGYWKLDEASGSTVYDYAGKSGTGTLYNSPSWVVSGAALGDTSIYTYSAGQLQLQTRYGDIFSVKNIYGAPATVHAYVIYDTTEQGIGSNIKGTLDSSHYFGVYYENNSSVGFDVNYQFKNLNGLQNAQKCGVDLFSKTPGYQGSWKQTPAKIYTGGDSISVKKQTAAEYVMVLYETDSTKLLSTPTGKPWYCGSDSVLLTAAGSDSFTYAWYKNGSVLSGKNKNALWVTSTGKYRVKMTRNGTSCSYASTEMSISNRNKPSVSFKALTGQCESMDTLILRGGTPGGGVYSGAGIRKDSLFFPSQVKAGKYTITYTFTDTAKCSGTASQVQEIFALPRFTKSGALEYCNHKDSLALTLIQPSGGTYSGKFIANNTLYLNKTGYKTGYYPFNYTFTDANQCTNTLRDSFLVKQSTFCFLDSLPDFCLKDPPLTLSGFPSPGVFSGNGVSGNQFDASSAGPGKHLIKYYYTNSNKCTTVDSQMVQVFNNSAVSWNYTLKTCENADSIQLPQGTPKGGFFTGKGVRPNGVFIPRSAGAGIHSITYNVSDANGCKNKTSNDITLLDTAKLSQKQPDPLCPDALEFNLSAFAPSGGLYSGSYVSSNIFYPRQAGSGKHPVQYTYTQSNSCKSSGCFNLEVTATDSIDVWIKPFACVYDAPITLHLYPFGGILKGNALLSGQFYPAFAGAGTHRIYYSKTDSHQCNTVDSADVFVSEAPKAGLGKYNSICSNVSDFQLTGGVPADSGTYFVNQVKQNFFSPSQSGKGLHTIEYKVINAYGCRDSASARIRVHPVPSKPVITLQNNELISSELNGNQWHNREGIIPNQTGQKYKPDTEGYYAVSVTSDSGCTVISDSVWFKKVSARVQTLPEMQFYPNPVKNGMLHYRSSGPAGNIGIWEISGKFVAFLPSEHAEGTWDLRSYKPGLYFIRAEFNDKVLFYPIRILAAD